jgi:hypothetical protein
VSGIFLPLRVNSLPLATIYEVKIPLRKWKISLLQRNPAQMTWHIDSLLKTLHFLGAKEDMAQINSQCPHVGIVQPETRNTRPPVSNPIM